MPRVPESELPPSEIERELARYLRYVSLERGRSPHTVAAYRGDLGHYSRWLRQRRVTTLGAITPEHVREYVGGLEGARTTVARKLSSVKNFHRFLLENSAVGTDVSTEIPAPRLPGRLPKALTIEQVGALMGAVGGDDPLALRDRALVEFLYATGTRISEVMALHLDDVLDDAGRVSDTVRVMGKGRKQRIIPVGSFAQAALESYLTRVRPVLAQKTAGTTVRRAGGAASVVFLGARGGPLTRQNAWLIIQRAAALADLEGLVSPHTLRHSFATHLVSGGADIRVVQELLGHSSVATTQIYTRVTIDTLRDVYAGAHPRAR